MSDTVITVEGLSKLYRIGSCQNDYKTLRDAVADAFTTPFRRLRKRAETKGLEGNPNLSANTIWALKDVSFEIKRGEVVGIIGRNGAGKSTLLKILSRITEPTEGRAKIHGRVGSLLEVGTGFHPELTGRENIYLNGAILGMRKAEIARKFDEMVAFAEVEKFIDTPVKHYSTGMYLRLAFAVAAHLEPEILLVDEVLAVGDAQFQKKCLGKMRDVAKEGRTVLFVSHQMGAVKSLCSRAIQIANGSIAKDGDAQAVITHYLGDASEIPSPELICNAENKRLGNYQVKLISIRILDSHGKIQSVFQSSQPILIDLEFELYHKSHSLFVGFALLDKQGVLLLQSCHNHGRRPEWPQVGIGLNHLRCTIPSGMLNTGLYYVVPRIGLNFSEWILFNDVQVGFEVQLDHFESEFWRASHSQAFPGIIAPILSWETVHY